jgi:hypothetical protein
MAHPRAKAMAFHMITDGSPIEIPYDSHRPMPVMKNAVNGRLISCALLNLNRRHTCGIKPTVVRAPPTNPRNSLHSKVCLLLSTLGQSICCLSNHHRIQSHCSKLRQSVLHRLMAHILRGERDRCRGSCQGHAVQRLEPMTEFKGPYYLALSPEGRPRRNNTKARLTAARDR